MMIMPGNIYTPPARVIDGRMTHFEDPKNYAKYWQIRSGVLYLSTDNVKWEKSTWQPNKENVNVRTTQ